MVPPDIAATENCCEDEAVDGGEADTEESDDVAGDVEELPISDRCCSLFPSKYVVVAAISSRKTWRQSPADVQLASAIFILTWRN